MLLDILRCSLPLVRLSILQYLWLQTWERRHQSQETIYSRLANQPSVLFGFFSAYSVLIVENCLFCDDEEPLVSLALLSPFVGELPDPWPAFGGGAMVQFSNAMQRISRRGGYARPGCSFFVDSEGP
jgi:hypothetical protein